MNYRDVDRLERILEVIGHIERRHATLSRDDFVTDIDEAALTAFRLSLIGEAHAS